MDLKILSWNVEHFTGNKTGDRKDRVRNVVDLIKADAPDIFALMEVEGSTIFREFTDSFPGWSFSVTEGPQVQEILIGWRSGLSAFMTHRNEFKSGNKSLRPAALLTISPSAGETLSLLFSHLKSFPSPEGYGLRDGMIEKVRKLKRAIDRGTDKQGKFIVLGDLNTMGLNLTFSQNDLTGPEETARIDKILGGKDMHRQPKTHGATFNNGSKSSYDPADLDHVYASSNCDFVPLADGSHIRIAGWAEEPDQASTDAWIAKFSDHAPLIFTLQNL